ncbi:MAG: lysophospholipid acyltransferase family protein [Thermoanaerobaculaceae bacterium]|nr:lysophospholipid acyltransferase family protein [Thermoanaerobaculaceae bacterium]
MRVAGGIRAVGRLIAFVVGSWLVVARAYRAVFSDFPERWRRNGPHNARWARVGARCLGIRVRRVGAPPPPGALVVANHFGYADVLTIGGLFPVVFAARHDMRRWPMFGALAASGATIFINRQQVRAGARGVAQVAQALSAGATVLGFPEGTSAGAGALLPFRSGLFQAAVDAGAPVVPAAVRYLSIDGAPVTAANLDVIGWFHGENFIAHALRLASHRLVVAEVRFGEPILPPHADRRTLAAAVEARVRALLDMPSARATEGGAS